jgi:CheY-like chemotaxis protein
MTAVNLKPVLYVEDDENDVFFMQKVWKALALPNPLEIVRDGKEAVDYFADPAQPANLSLILLDLNLPSRPGLDVLEWIRQQPSLCTLPILILTSSSHDRDVHTAYRLGANAYLLKPPQAKDLNGLVKGISDFWLQRNQPPPDPREFETSPTSSL